MSDWVRKNLEEQFKFNKAADDAKKYAKEAKKHENNVKSLTGQKKTAASVGKDTSKIQAEIKQAKINAAKAQKKVEDAKALQKKMKKGDGRDPNERKRMLAIEKQKKEMEQQKKEMEQQKIIEAYNNSKSR